MLLKIKRHTDVADRHTISNHICLPRAVETIWPRPLAESPCQVPSSRSASRVVSLLPRLMRTAAKSVLLVPRRSSEGLYLARVRARVRVRARARVRVRVRIRVRVVRVGVRGRGGTCA